MAGFTGDFLSSSLPGGGAVPSGLHFEPPPDSLSD